MKTKRDTEKEIAELEKELRYQTTHLNEIRSIIDDYEDEASELEDEIESLREDLEEAKAKLLAADNAERDGTVWEPEEFGVVRDALETRGMGR